MNKMYIEKKSVSVNNHLKNKYRLCFDGLIVERITGKARGFVYDNEIRDSILKLSGRAQNSLLKKYLYTHERT